MTGLLFDTIGFTQPTRRHVPDTSKAAHREAVASGRISQRAEQVLDWLRHYVAHSECPTSAELAYLTGPDTLEHVLYVRRGLSDLLKLRMVAKSTDRKCEVSKRTCNTWKVASR